MISYYLTTVQFIMETRPQTIQDGVSSSQEQRKDSLRRPLHQGLKDKDQKRRESWVYE